MLRFRRTEQPHTDYSTSAMETRDHSNGVSPKNQRSRGNQSIKNYALNQVQGRIMRKLALFFVAAMLLNVTSALAQGGTIGPLTWNITNGTLTISGSGDMPSQTTYPWSSYSFHTLVIESSVKSIASKAFNGCTNLGTVKIEEAAYTNELKFAGSSNNGHFAGCNIITLYLGRNLSPQNYVNPCNGYPFSEIETLKTITIGKDVTKINDYGFYNCTGLTQITSHRCPAPTIYSNTFSGVPQDIPIHVKCSCLESYENDQYWKNFTNYPCDEILFGDISDKTTSGNSVFAGLTGNTLSIYGKGNMADFWYSGEPFNGQAPWWWDKSNHLQKIQNVFIKSGVTNIGDKAFIDCTNLTTIENWGNVKIIGKKSFENCSSMQIITIPNSVIEIEDHAFYNCVGLKDITIGNNVKKIGNYAFYDYCPDTIRMLPTTPPEIQEKSFSNCGGKGITVVYVCSTCIDTYKNHPLWGKMFSDFRPFRDVGIDENIEQKLQIYPNPTSGEIQVTSYELQVTSIEVYDVMGRKALTSPVSFPSPETTLSLSHLPTGVYFLKIQTENGVVVRKVVKQ